MIGIEDFGLRTRLRLMHAIVGVLFVVLFLRLYQLQLLYHSEFGKRSEENSVRTVIKEPVRGYMYDRTGRLMVDVGPSFSVTVTPVSFDTAQVPELSALLEMNPAQLIERINRGRAHSRFSPVRVSRDVTYEVLASVEERLYRLPGVSYDVEWKRTYETGIRAAHLLGYCKEISDAQLTKLGATYRQGDVIGSTGLEASYETFLRGEKGFEFIAVNSKGQMLGPLDGGSRDVDSKDGFDLILSLDLGLQAYAESLMANYRGALVAMDPNDGGILAMVSKPDFDPSVFSGVTPADEWVRLNNDPEKPLFNRATMTRYPPGSTFKMLLAVLALEQGTITEHTTVRCTGGYRFGNRIFKDLHVHGTVNIREAIQQSCNVFFYQLILKTGLDPWFDQARAFGFAKPTGFDTNEETGGLIPNTYYYDRVYGKGRWTQGQLVNLGVGQGEVGVSPLQMARYVAALANGGTLLQPHAVSRIYNKRTNRYSDVDAKPVNIGVSKKTLDIVREGMRWVVEKPGGTGGMARISGVPSAGKTGTAENPHGSDHAWYVGFAPYENPTIAIAVLLENAGFGGTQAAPVAGKVMRRYLGVPDDVWRPAPTAAVPTKDSTASVAHPDTTVLH